MLENLLHQHVEHVRCFVHLVVHLAFVVGTTVGVSKIDWLNVFVVPLFPPILLESDEEVNML